MLIVTVPAKIEKKNNVPVRHRQEDNKSQVSVQKKTIADNEDDDGDDDEESTVVEKFRTAFEDVSDTVNRNVATLNAMIDKKQNSLQKLVGVVDLYKSMQTTTTTATEPTR